MEKVQAVAKDDRQIFFISNTSVYSLTEGVLTNEDGISYIGYGVRAENYSGVKVEYKDISLNRGLVSRLVEKLNCMNVSIIHFKDVIEDFVAVN